MLKFHQALKDAFPDFNEVGHITTKAANDFIKVRYEDVTFTMQSGDVSEFGVNGVQSEEILMYVKSYLEILNSNLESKYNREAIFHIQKAIEALNLRTKDRVARGVEGTSEK